MVAFDATEALTPCREGRGYGAILFDRERLRQADAALFSPAHWGEKARPVGEGGRGGAWFVDAPFGPCVLRHYLRGGLAARLSHDRYLWQRADRTRSFAEFRILRELLRRKCPVPQPVAACYLRGRFSYRAWIIVERLREVRSLADLVREAPADAPWEDTGVLIARFHREGLDHADLNAHNVLYDARGKGWLIDLDNSRMHIPATAWRERNLQRLLRSLHKVAGAAEAVAVEAGFARRRKAYDARWARGN